MNKSYYSLGLMSGTSMDGIDASIIYSNGVDEYKTIFNEYWKYDISLYRKLCFIRDKINTSGDLNLLSNELQLIEKEITLFNAKLANKLIKNNNVDLIGFHGQTVFHNAIEKISKQLGDGNLLSELTKKTVVYDFRKNDLKKGGEGAPLAPIFHTIINKKLKNVKKSFLNIGGIANETIIFKNGDFSARDVGPGNCLIDKWIKIKSDKFFDENGDIARSGKINKKILDKLLYNFYNNVSQKRSYDTNDFDLSPVKDLSLSDGAATLTELTSEILSKKILNNNIYVCGGGRKNRFLIENIENKIKNKIELIDKIGIDGDFVESQAFAFLAIRSYLKLPISFPKTTGCIEPTTGGIISKNF
tara:strand:- start:254 stop:1330 length:1077 start_codon:yes stop_codon:yes gene_type:complete